MDGPNIRVIHRAAQDGAPAETLVEIGEVTNFGAPDVSSIKAAITNLSTARRTPIADVPVVDALRPTFANATDLADWLDTLHECAISSRKWGAAQRAAAAIRSAAPTLEWSHTLCNGERVTYKQAEAAVAALNEKLAPGEPQWRIPERTELESILDLSRCEPAIDTERFPDTQSGAYWSSTPCAWSPVHAWVVLFSGGLVGYYHRGYSLAFVRAVRSVPAGQ